MVHTSAMGDDSAELNVPLVFRENIGQWDKEVLFKGSSSAANIYFTRKGMVVGHTRQFQTIDKKDEIENLYWKINFLGALENVKVKTAGAASSYTNYLIGTQDQHRTNVRDYNELIYENIYRGIDLHYYSHGGELKYDFILSPGANIESIQLNCEGVKNVRLNKNGEIEISHRWGTVLEKKPYSYQEINGKRKEVDIRYEIKEGNTYGYKIFGGYDPSKKIIIDPLSILWGTYVGGNSTTVSGYQYDIAVDDEGNTYATGYYPQSFPTSTSAFDKSFNGGYGDVFVYKMNTFGSNLLYATYVGGNDDDRGNAIAVNNAGEVFVAGYTFSAASGFPKTVQFGATASSSNAFVFKLNSSGNSLSYCVYMGANDQEAALDVAVNSVGEAIVVGETKSYNFPMAATTYDNTYNGAPYDGFFVKLNAAGTAMLSSGFLGGLRDDRARGVTVDLNDGVYITGYTGSTNFPTSAGAYDNVHNGGLDVFVMKFNPTMTTPIYSTYLGGSYDEEGAAIGVTPYGEAVITGYTFSPSYPKTDGSSYKGLRDIILTRINGAGSSIVYSKTIGGSRNDEGTSIAVDDSSIVYLAGITQSTNVGGWVDSVAKPYTPPNGPELSILNGEYNVYVGIFCEDGRKHQTMLLGGTKDDYNKPSIGLKDPGRVCDVMLGFTSHSADLPTTSKSYQPRKLNGGTENDQLALFKIMITKDTIITGADPITWLCKPDTFQICRITKLMAHFCDTIIEEKCHTYIIPKPPGEDTPDLSSLRIYGCSTVMVGSPKFDLVPIVETYIKPTSLCSGVPDTLFAFDNSGLPPLPRGGALGVSYLWSTGETGVFILVNQPGVYWLRTTNSCGVSFTDTVEIYEADKPTVDLGPDRTFCFPATTTLVAVNANDTIPTFYDWTPDGQTTPFITVSTPDTFCVNKRNRCGSASDCIIINPSPLPVVDLGKDTSICNSNAIILDAGNPGATYLWSPGGEITQTIQVSTAGTYSVTVTNSCGSSSDQINVSIATTPPVVGLGPDLLLCSPGNFPHTLDAGNTGSNYYWSTGSNNQTISATAGGIYFVTVTNGCGQDRDTIRLTAPPSLGLDLGADTTPCIPASITLDAGNSGATYLWTPGGEITQTKTVISSGNYSVSVTNACGTVSDTITVVFYGGPPPVNLGPNRRMCPGTAHLLTSGIMPGFLYKWSTGETTPTITVNTPGIYWLDVTNGCGTSRDSILLINDLPSFSLGPDRTVCAPATINLSAAGAGTSFLWSTGATNNSINVTTAGIYWVDVTNSCGTVRDSVTVSISSGIPNVNLGPDQLQCAAFSTTLNAGNPGATYLWQPGGQTTQSITVSTGGQYSVTATNGCGSDRDTILIITQPAMTLGPDRNICQSGSITLDAGNQGATYAWTPGGQTTQTISVSASGTYQVTITNGCGSVTDDINVSIINTPPSVDLGPDQRICAPASVMLDAGNVGSTYLWSTGATTQTITASTTGTYTVTVSNACGNDTDSIDIKVDNGIPSVDLGTDQQFCNPLFFPLDAGDEASSYSWSTGAVSRAIFVTTAGNYAVTVSNSCGNASDNILIEATDLPHVLLKDTGSCNLPIVLNAGNSGSTYFWSPGAQTTQTITASTTGVYSLTMSNACGMASGSANVVINAAVPSVALGADTNLCSPSGLQLDAGVQTGGKYLWSPGGDTTRYKVVLLPGTYSVSVANYCGTTSDNITITANPVVVNAKFEDTICIGASVRLYTDSLTGYTYSWTPTATLINATTPSPTATPIRDTEYFVTTSDGTCSNIDSVTIHVDNPIRPDIDIFPPTTEGFVPLKLIFKDRNNIGTSYIWDFDDGATSTQNNPSHVFNSENYFDVTVIAITENGCRAYDTITIKAFTLIIPNLITPNGDGKNDTWEITKLHDELYVEIYNRWGDRVYRHDHYINEWGGENLSDGVYYYLVEDRKFGQKYKGWLQILRDGESIK